MFAARAISSFGTRSIRLRSKSKLPSRSAFSTHGLRLLSADPSPALSGRTCLITGGTSGIGHAIAARFLQEGAERVILVGRSRVRLLDAARRLSGPDWPESDLAAKRSPGERPSAGEEQNGTVIQASEKISLLIGDVGKLSTGGWIKDLEREMESVDILVNAAGLAASNILPNSELSDISQTLSTNLEGAILTSRAFLRSSIRARVRARSSRNVTGAGAGASARTEGSAPSHTPPTKCIINISSLLAVKGGAGAVSYAASKAGILGLTRAVTAEAAKSLRDVPLRSNVIVPGYIETPMISAFSKGEVTRLKESIPLRRFGDPEEVADAAVFLARNEYANNCVLNLDGGLSAI